MRVQTQERMRAQAQECRYMLALGPAPAVRALTRPALGPGPHIWRPIQAQGQGLPPGEMQVLTGGDLVLGLTLGGK